MVKDRVINKGQGCHSRQEYELASSSSGMILVSNPTALLLLLLRRCAWRCVVCPSGAIEEDLEP